MYLQSRTVETFTFLLNTGSSTIYPMMLCMMSACVVHRLLTELVAQCDAALGRGKVLFGSFETPRETRVVGSGGGNIYITILLIVV